MTNVIRVLSTISLLFASIGCGSYRSQSGTASSSNGESSAASFQNSILVAQTIPPAATASTGSSTAAGATTASSAASRTVFIGAVNLGNGKMDLLFQETNGDISAWVGNGGYDFGDFRKLTFGGRTMSSWNPAATTRFVGAADLGNGKMDLLFQEGNGDLKAWIGNGGYDFGDVRNLTFGGRAMSYWNPAATSKFIAAVDLGNGKMDLLFQEANGDLKAWIGNGGYDFGDVRNLTFGGRMMSYWNPAATSKFIGAADLGNGKMDLLFQEANGDLKAWVGNGGYDFGDIRQLTFGGRALSYWNPAGTTRFIAAVDLGNGKMDLLFQESNEDLKTWIGNGGFDFGDVRNLTFGGKVLSAW